MGLRHEIKSKGSKMNNFEITLEQFEKNIDDFLASNTRVAEAQFRCALHYEYPESSKYDDICIALEILNEAPISKEEKIAIALEDLGYYVGIKETRGYHDHEYILEIKPENINHGDYSGKIYFSKIEAGWAIDGWLISSSSTPSPVNPLLNRPDATFSFSTEVSELKTFDLLPVVHTGLPVNIEQYLIRAINLGIRDICKKT